MSRRILALAGALAAALLLSTQTRAATVAPNATLLTWTPEAVTFEHDLHSPYDLAFAFGEEWIDVREGRGTTLYTFTIPNFVDDLPLKTVEIAITADPPGNGSHTGWVRGWERSGGRGKPHPFAHIPTASDDGLPVPPSDIVRLSAGYAEEGIVWLESWRIVPNPDWEVVQVTVPKGFALGSIEIQAMSVPLPAAGVLMLGALALLGASAGRRRRR